MQSYRVFVYICGCMHPCLQMQRPEKDIGCFSLLLAPYLKKKTTLYFIMFLYARLGDGGDGGGMVYVQKFEMSSPSIFKLVLVQVSRLVGQVPLLPEPSP